MVDNHDAAVGVVAHLAALGHRRVGHIAGPQNTTTGVERREGYRAGVLAFGLADEPELVVEATAFSEEGGHRALQMMLAGSARPTAVFAANDLIAIGMLQRLRQIGAHVPGDLSIVGFNDIPLAGLLEPALTTVRVPQLDMGVAGADLLIDRLEARPIDQVRLTLPTELVVRASSAAPVDRVRLSTRRTGVHPVKRLVDLTQPWGDRMPTWPQFASIEVTDITTHHRDRKSTMLVKTNMHTGTHIDAPSHYWETGRDLGRIELSELYGTALVIDLRPITRPWSYYSLADIEAHVPPGESIRDGDIVVLYTGWDRVQLDQADA